MMRWSWWSGCSAGGAIVMRSMRPSPYSGSGFDVARGIAWPRRSSLRWTRWRWSDDRLVHEGAAADVRTDRGVLGVRRARPDAVSHAAVRARRLSIPGSGSRARGIQRSDARPDAVRQLRIRSTGGIADAAAILRSHVRPALERRLGRAGGRPRAQG